MVSYLKPALDNVRDTQTGLNASEIAIISHEEDRYLAYWSYLPVIILIIILFWLVLNAVRKNKEEGYG
jgi:hypothetical protein